MGGSCQCTTCKYGYEHSGENDQGQCDVEIECLGSADCNGQGTATGKLHSGCTCDCTGGYTGDWVKYVTDGCMVEPPSITVYGNKEYKLKTSGECNNLVETAWECRVAAQYLEQNPSTNAQLSAIGYDGDHIPYDSRHCTDSTCTYDRPPGCVYHKHNDRLHAYRTANQGSCTSDHPCLCRTTSTAPSRPAISYKFVTSGNDFCLGIKSKNECNEAAEFLDHSDDTADSLDLDAQDCGFRCERRLPKYCFAYHGSRLYYNSGGYTTNSEPTPEYCSDRFSCLCKDYASSDDLGELP